MKNVGSKKNLCMGTKVEKWSKMIFSILTTQAFDNVAFLGF